VLPAAPVASICTLLAPAGTAHVEQPCVVNSTVVPAAAAEPASESAQNADTPAATEKTTLLQPRRREKPRLPTPPNTPPLSMIATFLSPPRPNRYLVRAPRYARFRYREIPETWDL
jgi:hypothetical protein